MEVDKFEKHIKKRLNERQIGPSEDAWNRLSEQLPEVAPKKKNTFFWYSVAAVLMGVLMVSSLYFKRNRTPEEMKIEVVGTPQEVNVPENNEDVKEPMKVEDNLVEATHREIREGKGPVVIPSKKLIKDEPQFVMQEDVKVADQSADALKIKTEELIDAKIAELAKQVGSLESSDFQVTDAEVDSLLRRAQQEILADKIFNEKGKVDAMALLDEVENELDRTFREQIFESLKTGFDKVRTAVADRND